MLRALPSVGHFICQYFLHHSGLFYEGVWIKWMLAKSYTYKADMDNIEQKLCTNDNILNYGYHKLCYIDVLLCNLMAGFLICNLQDDFPLASLPLLGYTVSSPSEQDAIHKEYVFKLQFKNHVYFFRAESEYTFGR